MTMTELSAYAPGFDFAVFFKSAGLASLKRVVLGTNTAFPKFARIFENTPLDTLKAWQAFVLVNGAAPYLSKRFVDARFDFYGKTLQGRAENEARWRRGVTIVSAVLPDAIGRMYVAQHFSPQAKAKMDALVKELIAAMHGRIARVTWMSAATKQKAEEKLSAMTVRIGYPAKWRSYDALTVTADDAYGNVLRSAAFNWDYLLNRLDGPVDKQEWDMHPQDANAEYDPTSNAITFPAAILQPPFFDPDADMAVNYGGIGAIIGHEITHGFDDEGRHYDAEGRLSEWWTPQDAADFQARADRLGAQFDKFEPVKGFFVNGKLTMGENIADFGGLLLALDAYHASLHGQEPPVLSGFTGDQRLFLGWAQGWQTKTTEQATILDVKSDVHSPPQFRVDGPFRNIDAWYRAFHIQPGNPMYLAPAARVGIW
jgi:putative endopeptidase